MLFSETAHMPPEMPAVALDYAQIWQAAEKVVYLEPWKAYRRIGPGSSASSSRRRFAG